MGRVDGRFDLGGVGNLEGDRIELRCSVRLGYNPGSVLGILTE